MSFLLYRCRVTGLTRLRPVVVDDGTEDVLPSTSGRTTSVHGIGNRVRPLDGTWVVRVLSGSRSPLFGVRRGLSKDPNSPRSVVAFSVPGTDMDGSEHREETFSSVRVPLIPPLVHLRGRRITYS